jgi:hypothetical protein
LSLRNQYDTKTPRARIFFCCARQTDGTVIRAIRRPSREKPGTCSRHEKSYSVGFEMSVENLFRNKKIRKIPSEIPNHCRTIAAADAANGSKVIFKRSTWTREPQAVLKDSC